MRLRYTQEQVDFLRKGYQRMQIPELTAAFNARFGLAKPDTAIKSALSSRWITCGRPTGNRKRYSRLFTREQVAFIVDHYPAMGRQRLTDTLNCKFNTEFKLSQIITFVKNHNIQSGRTGHFEPGHKPWNAGKHFDAGGRSAETRFKPGSKPSSWVPIGTEALDKEGYLKRKIRDDAPPGMTRRNWKYVHVLVWEEHNGPVPDGHIVAFQDGDKHNCDIENLVLLTRQENLYLNCNGYAELPAELRPSMRALAKVEAKRFGLLRTTKSKHSDHQ